MKIAFYDPYLMKFTSDMVDHWRAQGHEVRVDRYYDPEIAWDADLIWFDTCDNNLLSATNPSEAILADPNLKQPWKLQDFKKPNQRIIVRPIDIEVWSGHHAHDNVWQYVDDVIFLAPHIQDIFNADSRTQGHKFKQHLIPHSVNLDKWTFKEQKPGFNIGIVSEIWESKGMDLVLQVALKLKQIDERYGIKWVGKMQTYHWDTAYFNEFIKHHDLDIEVIDWVESIDEFLEDKNYLLHCSLKEAFSAATAEAMAKGIKPVIHRFFGADALWPGITWSSIDEAVKMITEDTYDSASYRQYLINHEYTTPQMMERIDKIIKGEQ